MFFGVHTFGYLIRVAPFLNLSFFLNYRQFLQIYYNNLFYTHNKFVTLLNIYKAFMKYNNFYRFVSLGSRVGCDSNVMYLYQKKSK